MILLERLFLAIDPGPEQSAFVLYDPEARARVRMFAKLRNRELLEKLPQHRIAMAKELGGFGSPVLAVEMIASYGMAVGREVFETCVWIGRFVQAWGGDHELLYRRDVKLHLCGSMRARDANVRQALLDRFGPGKEKAVGTKRAPGPLYGVHGDVWAALGVAVTYADRAQQARAA